MRRITLVVMAVSMWIPGTSFASGFEYPDNGAKGLAQGGAFAASADDPTAMYFNPALLTDLDGLHLALDPNIAFMSTTFQRTGVIDPSGAPIDVNPVSNTYAPWIAGLGAVSYGLPDILSGLTISLGVWGPSAYGKANYPDPRDIMPTYFNGDSSDDPTDTTDIIVQAPQRYGLISSDILVVYPSLGVSIAPIEMVSIGIVGQMVTGRTKFSQALYGGLTDGEDPGFEGVGDLNVKAKPTFTGIFGLSARPLEGMTVGLSLRPGFTQVSTGTLDIQFNDFLQDPDGLIAAEQTKNDATFTNDFPTVLRWGVAYGQTGWMAELGGTYEMWSRVEEFRLEPDIEIWTNLDPDAPLPVQDIIIPKNFDDAWSIRLGGRANLGELLGNTLDLTLRAGFVYEKGAIPDETLNLDFISGDRMIVSGGASYGVGPVEFTLTGAQVIQAPRTITDSTVEQSVSDENLTPTIVGNGTYEASITVLLLGVHLHFDV